MKEEKPASSLLGTLSDMITVVPFLVSAAIAAIAYLCKVPLYVSLPLAALLFFLVVRLLRKHRHAVGARLLAFVHGQFFPQRDWESIDELAEYTYRDRETMEFLSQYKVKVVSGLYKEIPDRFKWSAGKVDRVSAIERGQDIVPIPDEKKDDVQVHLGYQDFHITLPKSHSYHDKPFPTGFRCEGLHDPGHKAITCLIVGIYRKTSRMTLRVRFAKSLNVTQIRKMKYADFLDAEPYECKPGKLELDEAQEFHFVEFTIDHPIVGAKYVIDWEFIE